MSKLITGTQVWRYVMEGIVPPGLQTELINPTIKASVSWTDNILPFCRGSNVSIRAVTPQELAELESTLRRGPGTPDA